MNLKYYLRGLGIGIVMTAIILSAGTKKETLSDAEIKQRAAQLGMVEQSGLLTEREEGQTTEKESVAFAKPEQKPQITKEPEATKAPEVTKEPEEEVAESLPVEESISISVNPGDGSYTVCKRLEEAGLISSAEAFDQYMSENGYDKKLQVGKFEIVQGSTPEEIVMILMKRK